MTTDDVCKTLTPKTFAWWLRWFPRWMACATVGYGIGWIVRAIFLVVLITGCAVHAANYEQKCERERVARENSVASGDLVAWRAPAPREPDWEKYTGRKAPTGRIFDK